MGKRTLDHLTEQERKDRVNRQKYESLLRYLKTDEGKEYRRKCAKKNYEKQKIKRAEEKRLMEEERKLKDDLLKQIDELTNKIRNKEIEAMPEPPMLGSDSGNFLEKKL